MNEPTVAYENTPTIVLRGTGEWDDRIEAVAFDSHYLDRRRSGYLHFADTAEEDVELAFRLARDGRPSSPLVG